MVLQNPDSLCLLGPGSLFSKVDPRCKARLGGLRWSGVSTNVALASAAAAPAERSAERPAERWGAAAQLLEEAQDSP